MAIRSFDLDPGRDKSRQEGETLPRPGQPRAIEAVFFDETETLKHDQPQPTELHQGTVEIGGAHVGYTLEMPEDVTDPVPLLIIPGFAGIKPAYRGLRTQTARHGKPAVTFRPARTQQVMAGLRPAHLFHQDKLPEQAVYGIMRDLSEQAGFETFDYSAHSMGGFIAANVAARYPEQVRSVIFMASVGLDGHNPIKLLRRLPSFFRSELLPAVLGGKIDIETNHAKVALEAISYMARNPYRTLGEGLAAGSCDIRPLLPELRAHGVRTAILGFHSDHLMPIRETAQAAGGLVDMLAVYPDENAGHIEPQISPRVVADIQLRMLAKLNG